jgi:hypothetical protein
MTSRRATGYESWFTGFSATIQSSVEFSNPRKATEFVDFLLKSLPTFHMRIEGRNLVYEKTNPEVVKIPARVNVLRCVSVDRSLEPPDETHLGSLAVRDNLVASSASHAFFDGVSLIILADRFRRGTCAS